MGPCRRPRLSGLQRAASTQACCDIHPVGYPPRLPSSIFEAEQVSVNPVSKVGGSRKTRGHPRRWSGLLGTNLTPQFQGRTYDHGRGPAIASLTPAAQPLLASDIGLEPVGAKCMALSNLPAVLDGARTALSNVLAPSPCSPATFPTALRLLPLDLGRRPTKQSRRGGSRAFENSQDTAPEPPGPRLPFPFRAVEKLKTHRTLHWNHLVKTKDRRWSRWSGTRRSRPKKSCRSGDPCNSSTI